MKKIVFLGGIDMSAEAMEKRAKKRYEDSEYNLENMSYWLPKVDNENASVLLIPETKVVKLDYENWDFLMSENDEEIGFIKLNEFIEDVLDGFMMGRKMFMKTGVFSNKFEFENVVVEDREDIANKLKHMFFVSMMFGVRDTSEVVFREYIEDVEDREVIYEGMPLHTEFRVFYDFDKREVVGVSNYWHPDVMGGFGALSEEDSGSYGKEKDRLEYEFNELKGYVSGEVEKFMKSCTDLSGKWSVDVMKNGDDYWLIDMARMDRSALVAQMEDIGGI